MRIKWGDFAVVALVLAAAGLVFLFFGANGPARSLVAVVRIDGKECKRIALSDIPEGQTVTVSLKDGADMALEARRDGVRVAYSGCPDKVCVRTGWLKAPGQSAVCLPCRVVVRLEGERPDEKVDGIAG